LYSLLQVLPGYTAGDLLDEDPDLLRDWEIYRTAEIKARRQADDVAARRAKQGGR